MVGLGVRVVHEYVDVFHEEFGLPPHQETEFMIELMFGTIPQSKEPYHMEPSELKELKVQLEKLLEKVLLDKACHLGVH